MDRRLELQVILEALAPKVYFQPPTNLQMVYPCIVYKRDSADTVYAENLPYRTVRRYMVTVIDRNPDSEIPAKIAKLPMCAFNRFYTSDNLNHDVYNLFF